MNCLGAPSKRGVHGQGPEPGGAPTHTQVRNSPIHTVQPPHFGCRKPAAQYSCGGVEGPAFCGHPLPASNGALATVPTSVPWAVQTSVGRGRPEIVSPALLAPQDFCLPCPHPPSQHMNWAGLGGAVSAGINISFILLLLQSFSLAAERLM